MQRPGKTIHPGELLRRTPQRVLPDRLRKARLHGKGHEEIAQPMRLIVNATNIGRDLSGIGRYSLSLVLQLLERWENDFQVVINARAGVHFKDTTNRSKVRVVSGGMSPDFGLKGHTLRFLFTNVLSRQNSRAWIFNTSQLDAALFCRHQIVTVHDLIPLQFPEYHRRQFPYFKHLLPRVLERARMVIAVSQHVKGLMVENYGIEDGKIQVIYHGVNESFFHSVFDAPKERYILYVGRLSPIKNIQGLIRAFRIVSETFGLDVRLHLTGKKDWFLRELDGVAAKRISFLGTLSDECLGELYRRALVLVLPSFCEGFGLPALEAMACGCPVVASNVGALREVCGDAAEYVNPHDVESIAQGIHRVIVDEELRRNLISRGMERSRLFRWENTAREHIRVFQEAMNPH
jgi:glycosyltransferase involved in cell wall biosynthesis